MSGARPQAPADDPLPVSDLLDRIARLPGCSVLPPTGPPPDGLVLPPGLTALYRMCGGLRLFHGSDYPLTVRPPNGLVPVNQVLLDRWPLGDHSDTWYALADTGDGDLIAVDLDPDRLGRCYDSSAWTHAIAGSCAVVATSPTDLLTRAVTGNGDRWWWLQPGFRSLGDAYDRTQGRA